MEDARKDFAEPPREYAIYPIVHNVSALTDPKRAQSARYRRFPDLETVRDLGFGGLVVNVDYSSDYPENKGDWRSLADAVGKATDIGFKIWIYDEKGYPSGSAGGAVLDRRPELEAVGLTAYQYWRVLSGPHEYRSDTPNGKLFKALLVPLTGVDVPVDITETADERGTLRFEIPRGAYRLFVLVERDLYDGTHAAHSYSEPRRYINLLDAEATDEFIRVTHEHYKRHLGPHLGKSVQAFFTDEPSLMSWNTQPMPYPLLPWRGDFPDVFRTRYGYEIELALVAVMFGTGAHVVKRRCDFWELVSNDLAENFFGRLQDWCRANDTLATGHLLSEENLLSHLPLYGSAYASLKRFDAPGIDQLNSDPGVLMRTGCIPIARLAASVADVFDRSEVMTEASDHSQREANQLISIGWARASMNWHFALGVNVITSYYNFSPFSPDEVRDLNTYVARLGLMLRRGKRVSRVAVLYPECTLWASVVPTNDARSSGQPAEAQRMARTFYDVSWALLHRQIDFDYIDEDVLNDGDLQDGVLVFGSRRYEAVVLPDARVLRSATARKLADFMDAGGTVLAAGSLPALSRDGDDEQVRETFAQCLAKGDASLVSFETTGPDLPLRALSALPRTVRLTSEHALRGAISASGGLPSNDAPAEGASDGILAHVRKDGDDLIVFVANMAGSPWSGFIHIADAESCEMWDPADGTIAACGEAEPDDAGLRIKGTLDAYEGRFYVARLA